MRFVVDSNIIFSALLKNGAGRKLLLFPGFEFFTPDYVRIEVLNHMDILIERTNGSEKVIKELIILAFSNIHLIDFEFYEECLDVAYDIMKDIDENDTAILATSLSFSNDGIWTNDKHLHKQKKVRTMTTMYLLEMFSPLFPDH